MELKPFLLHKCNNSKTEYETNSINKHENLFISTVLLKNANIHYSFHELLISISYHMFKFRQFSPWIIMVLSLLRFLKFSPGDKVNYTEIYSGLFIHLPPYIEISTCTFHKITASSHVKVIWLKCLKSQCYSKSYFFQITYFKKKKKFKSSKNKSTFWILNSSMKTKYIVHQK